MKNKILKNILIIYFVFLIFSCTNRNPKQDTKGLFGAKDALKEVKSANEELTKSMMSEQVQINILFNRLRQAKESTLEYKNAKDAIMKQYGSYLEGLDAETISLKNIEKSYMAVSKAVLESARNKKMSESIAEVANNYSEVYVKNMNKIQETFFNVFEGKGKSREAIRKLFKEFIDQFNFGENIDFTPEMQKVIEEFTFTIPGYKITDDGKAVAQTANKIKDYIKEINDAFKDSEKQTEYIYNSFGNFFDDKTEEITTKNKVY